MPWSLTEPRADIHPYSHDLPTGMTPARMAYTYPRDLAYTEDHDSLISKFRATGTSDHITYAA